MIQSDIKINCLINEEEDDSIIMFINLLTNKGIIVTLEFADITSDLTDLIEINDHYELYEDNDTLIKDLEEGHLNRFLREPQDNERLDLLVNLRMKMRHQEDICNDQCILCNPDIGDDPFPDFIFNIRNADTEGEG